MLGPPNDHIKGQIGYKNMLQYFKENEGVVKQKTWEQMIPDAPPVAIDLISKCMTYNPKDRLTAKEILQHPFFEQLFDPDEDLQIVEGEPINYYDFEFEQYTLGKDILQELLLDEVILFNSKEARRFNRELRSENPHGALGLLYER